MLIALLFLFIQQNPWVSPAVEAPDLHHVVYYSETLQHDASFHVYIPPAYYENEDVSLPVLYYLHGSGGGLQGVPVLRNYFHNHMLNGTIPNMIVVFPWGLPLGMWVDSYSGHQPVETVIIEDLIPYIDANYRTIAHRSGRIVEGFSMGGYGAARFGLKYPELFAGFSMLGAGPVQLDFLNYPHVLTPLELRLEIFEEVYGNSQDYFEEVSPWRLAETAVGNLPEGYAIRNVVGTDDILLFMNRDLRDHWIDLGLGFSYLEVPDVDHAAMGLFIYLTQNGKQTFYSEAFATATSIEESRFDRPTGFELMQNYPNPFNPATTIRFHLSEPVFVSLIVQDITGRNVATLLHEIRSAGNHSIGFDAGSLPSGVYFYRLATEKGVQTRKMVLLK